MKNTNDNAVFRITAKENSKIIVDETFDVYEVSLPMTYEDFLRCGSEEDNRPRRSYPTVIAEGKKRIDPKDSSFRFDTCDDKTCVIETRMYDFESRNLEINIIYFSNSDASSADSTNDALFIRNIYKYNAESIVDMIVTTIDKVYMPSKIFDQDTIKYLKASDSCMYNGSTYVNKDKLKDMERQLRDALSRNNNLEDKNRSMSNIIDSVTSENNDIKIQKQRMSEEIERLNTIVSDLRSRKSEPISAQQTTVTGDKLSYQGVSYIKYDRYSEMSKQYTDNVEEFNKKIDRLNKEIDASRATYESNLEKYKSKIAKMEASSKGDPANLQMKIDELTSDIEMKDAVIAELEEAINGDPNKVSPAAVNGLRKQIEDLTSQLETLNTANKELEEKNNILQQWYDEYNSEDGGDEHPMSEDDLREGIECMEVVINEKQAAIQRAYDTLADLDEKIYNRKMELRKLNAEYNKLTKNNEQDAKEEEVKVKKEKKNPVEEASKIVAEKPAKRKYTRRPKEVIEAEKAEKAARAAERKRLGLGPRAKVVLSEVSATKVTA